MPIHVCFLITEHPFLDARIFKKEAKSLHKKGYQVTMIVPRKNGCLFDVDGHIFTDSYRSERFVHEGITIVTYEQMEPEKNIKELHYNLSSTDVMRFSDPLTRIGIEQQADIYHAHEFYSFYSGIGIKRSLSAKKQQCKLIYDSHELEPDPLTKQSQLTLKLKQEMLTLMFNETDHVITVSQSIKDHFRTLNPKPPIDVIYNTPPLAPIYKPGRGTQKGLTLVFEGTLLPERGNFSKLMKIVSLCNVYFDLNIRIIGGTKTSETKPLKIPPSLKNKVTFKGWVPYHLLPEAMNHADIGWIDLDAQHSLNNRYAMPNKLFSYSNNGIPVLVNQCDDMERFIHKHHCGYVVKKRQATAEDYVQALRNIHFNREQLQYMSTNARHVMEEKYSWDQMEKRLFAIYKHLAK